MLPAEWGPRVGWWGPLQGRRAGAQGAIWEALTHTDGGRRPEGLQGPHWGPPPPTLSLAGTVGGGGLWSPGAQSRLCGRARGWQR